MENAKPNWTVAHVHREMLHARRILDNGSKSMSDKPMAIALHPRLYAVYIVQRQSRTTSTTAIGMLANRRL